jgi:histidine phosphotransferase ChpT
MTSLAVLSLIVSKVCHDLASPLGAMANGAELLAEDSDPDMQRQAIDLIGQSSGQAVARMNLFRMAFGASGGDSPVPLPQVRAVAEAHFAGGRLALVWPPAAAAELDRTEARILLSLLLVGSQCLPRGGTLGIALAAGRVEVEAAGASVRVPDGLPEVLAHRNQEPTDSAHAVAAFAALAAGAAGGRLTSAGDGPLRLAFTRN